ncbi:MAG: hypothetical protein DWQ19_12815 [Crenarchaeota archaeon]|nr:MAG: hypothetical protein DWQ19_12815 [Thermoproteota archaeon]
MNKQRVTLRQDWCGTDRRPVWRVISLKNRLTPEIGGLLEKAEAQDLVDNPNVKVIVQPPHHLV